MLQPPQLPVTAALGELKQGPSRAAQCQTDGTSLGSRETMTWALRGPFQLSNENSTRC